MQCTPDIGHVPFSTQQGVGGGEGVKDGGVLRKGGGFPSSARALDDIDLAIHGNVCEKGQL